MSRLRRRTIPSAVIALSQVTWPALLAARIARARGRHGRVELYFAFDDAASAVAVRDLSERLAGRPVDLVLCPVVERGIAGDPARDAKRRHALADARRRGLDAARDEPVQARDVAFLAEWVAAAPPSPERERFCVQALAAIWRDEDALEERWRTTVGDAPPEGGADAVRRNERRMRRRGPYDTPAAVVGGRWYFAHDRGPQIAEWLDELGWTA